MPALAGAGFHAVAPDMRGFSQTEARDDIAFYTIVHNIADMVQLGSTLGEQQAVLVPVRRRLSPAHLRCSRSIKSEARFSFLASMSARLNLVDENVAAKLAVTKLLGEASLDVHVGHHVKPQTPPRKSDSVLDSVELPPSPWIASSFVCVAAKPSKSAPICVTFIADSCALT